MTKRLYSPDSPSTGAGSGPTAGAPGSGTMAQVVHMASLDITTDIDVLPTFVIGYEGARRDLRSAPPWLHVIQHQYAGLGCHQFEATGCMLPLAANQREGTGKLWLLTRALVELGESWPGDAVYGANEVAEFVGEIAELTGFGRGERAMNAHEVEAMAQLLARHLAFPGLAPPVAESGHEALIRFHDVDPSPFFDGWRVAYAGRCEPDGEPVWRECARYDRELARELQELVGRGARPRIFLLWENSD